ncbi:MAG: SUMF1/EgtB/PvdO family nonheme iron enzyme [Solirubrobacterales bacterium]
MTALDAMAPIPGATFRMGSDDHYAEEAPAHPVRVSPFWIDRTPVTNRQFAAFVAATGYVTVAERPLDPAQFPGAPPENLVAGSLVFTRTAGPVDLRHLAQWWTWTPGACWSRPEGRDRRWRAARTIRSSTSPSRTPSATRPGPARRCPPRRSGSLAARGGLDGAEFTWGDEPEPPGGRLAHYWHGEFPWRPDPGYGTTVTVGRYPANGYGLFDMAGNVWEWTRDWYAPRHPSIGGERGAVPRPGRRRAPREPRPGPAAVLRPAQGGQGRVVPLRGQLLPALPARRAPAADGGHGHEPHRLSLRQRSSAVGRRRRARTRPSSAGRELRGDFAILWRRSCRR